MIDISICSLYEISYCLLQYDFYELNNGCNKLHRETITINTLLIKLNKEKKKIINSSMCLHMALLEQFGTKDLQFEGFLSYFYDVPRPPNGLSV